MKVEDKSNEITAIPALLELLDIHYSQVKLKTLLSMSNFTHFLPVYPIKI